MQGNPYSAILKLMGDQGEERIPEPYYIGKVESVNPLSVSFSNTVQKGSDLFKNANIGELFSGDTVFLVPINDNQQFIILCKVVSV